MMATLKLWFSAAKLYVLLALLVAFAVAYWWHGHTEYAKGAADYKAQVAALTAKYAQASQDAADAARAMQQMYDAQALAEAQARAQASAQQVAALTTAKTIAETSAAKYAAALKEERKHDPVTATWLDTRVPDGVRAPGSR
jgi:hypothetical protein